MVLVYTCIDPLSTLTRLYHVLNNVFSLQLPWASHLRKKKTCKKPSCMLGDNVARAVRICHKRGKLKATAKVLGRSTCFTPSEIISSEAMGTELPRRCPACNNCKECQFRMDNFSYKENTEKLQSDNDRKKWVAEYPSTPMLKN
jgi:hypothetical protein